MFPSSPVPLASLPLTLAAIIAVHLLLWLGAEALLGAARRRRAALLAALPAGARVVGWAVTVRGEEVLVAREAGGRLRAVGLADARSETAALRWLMAEGWLDARTQVNRTGPRDGDVFGPLNAP